MTPKTWSLKVDTSRGEAFLAKLSDALEGLDEDDGLVATIDGSVDSDGHIVVTIRSAEPAFRIVRGSDAQGQDDAS